MPTGKEMCETIAEHWKRTNSPMLRCFPGSESQDIETFGERIWKYSPTGELYDIFFWYYDIVGYPTNDEFWVGVPDEIKNRYLFRKPTNL